MLQSVLVYTILTFTMVFFGILAQGKGGIRYKSPFLNFGMICLLLTFSVVMAVRYDVGTDYLNYLDVYGNQTGVERMEWGFRTITNFLANNDFHFAWFFGIIAFLQIFFLFYAFKDNRSIYPYLSFVLIFGAYFIPLANIMRQGVAVCIFIYAIQYIDKRKIWHYIACCSLAMLFHRSAVLLFPLYFLFKGKDTLFKSKNIQIILLTIAVSIHYLTYDILSIASLVNAPIEVFIKLLDYQNYALEHLFASKNLSAVDSGLGFLVATAIDFFIVLFSKKLQTYFSSKRFTIFYNIYFVGALIRILFSFSYIILRPFAYFTFMKLIVLSYLFVYLWENIRLRRTPIYLALFFLFMILSILPFIINGETNHSLFKFFWDENPKIN